MTVAVVIAAAGGGAAALHSRSEHKRKREHAAAVAAQKKKAAEKAASDARAAAAQAALASEIKRSERTSDLNQLRAAITKDAQKDYSDGLLEDRATGTTCQNTDGRASNLNATSAAFQCTAITDHSADGTERGFRFTARINYSAGSFTWHLGD